MHLALATLLTVIRMVVIPAEFSGGKFACSREEIGRTVAEAEAYFNDQFAFLDCRFEFILSPTVSLRHPVSYYGANYSDRRDILLHEAVREAVEAAADSGTDFSLCDYDNDGYVDNVMLYTAGPAESAGGGENAIWPQYDRLSSHGVSLSTGGKCIDSYTVCCEQPGGIALFCHELGHALGFPDLYDTDSEGSGGFAEAMYHSSIMDPSYDAGASVPDLCAVEMELLGIGRCSTLEKGEYSLTPVKRGGEYLKAEGPEPGEYFLFECREGRGLLVHHIDKSAGPAGYSDYYSRVISAQERWEKGQINNNPGHPCAMVIRASSSSDGDEGLYFPCGDTRSFSSLSDPSFRFWNSRPHRLALTGIRLEDSGELKFRVIEPVILEKAGVFQDAVILRWRLDASIENVSGFTVRWSGGRSGETLSADIDSPHISGFTIEGLQPNTVYLVEVEVRTQDGTGFSASEMITTKVRRDGVYPYIYLNGIPRNNDGSFPYGTEIPLRVFNASDACEVIWTLDSAPIATGADGFYTLQRSGRLKAVIVRSDGSRESIYKDIVVK